MADTAGESSETTTFTTKPDQTSQNNDESQASLLVTAALDRETQGHTQQDFDDDSQEQINHPYDVSEDDGDDDDEDDDDAMMVIETPEGLTLLDHPSYYFVHDHEAHSENGSGDPSTPGDSGMSGERSITEELMHNIRRQSVGDLPETVTKLETPEGCVVYVIGTAHFSKESQEDVAKTIQAVQPDRVLVELCKSRIDILKYDEEFLLREAKNIDMQKLKLAIKQSGVVGGIMQVLLLSMSAHITQQLGMAPGGEFRAAYREARKLGCQVHLGDRPIQVTLSRAMAALTVWQKVKLAWHLLTTKEPISPEDVERCKQKDLLAEMLAEMTGDFPLLYKVFVTERDQYLARSLRLSAVPNILSNEIGEPQGIIPSVTVGVVGIGHVAGIVENFHKFEEIDIQELMRIPEATLASKVLKTSLKAAVGLTVSAFGVFLAWGCYRVIRFTNVTSYMPVLWRK
ncbi:traB domain-containing protein isoform X2 [Nematostella vectensis]|uniref:traB domain-containing protein isoform X2 n=1 Tax=Nematostella vectensis TaxID=45351 RepID=UPI0013905141|nr:traB domain-containing protein isoform X2 [Nematostella vectensis]